ncbi:MAG: hypothetical protein E7379_02960 [Clostridiales bacterium]|nr:hypothetical protein [Clostridiales bacterium]
MSNKKLSIAVMSLAVAVCFVVGGLIGAWAAIQQSVGSSFDVQYTVGSDIAATVSAKYQVLNGQETQMGAITFAATEEQGATSYDKITAGKIDLSVTNKSITFTYTFLNIGENEYEAVLADNCSYSNVTVTPSKTSVKVAPGAGVEGSGVDAVEVTIQVTIIDTNKSAHYTSNSTAGLVWTLTSTTPTNP